MIKKKGDRREAGSEQLLGIRENCHFRIVTVREYSWQLHISNVFEVKSCVCVLTNWRSHRK